MTLYRNFIQDFPSRCKRILDDFFTDATQNDLEVTLLLNVAASAVIVPFERLLLVREKPITIHEEHTCPNCNKKISKPKQIPHFHPSQDDDRYKSARAALMEILDTPFSESGLCSSNSAMFWKFAGNVDPTLGSPDQWKPSEALNPQKTTRKILKIIRNALAHGNIELHGRDQIDELLFLSRSSDPKSDAYDCISVPPGDFKHFIIQWIDVLKTNKLPLGIVPEMKTNVA